MKVDDLAAQLHRRHNSDYRFGADWDVLSDEGRDRWRKTAGLAAEILGVALDPETDPRYEAALRALNDANSLSDMARRLIARAIVAALDVKE